MDGKGNALFFAAIEFFSPFSDPLITLARKGWEEIIELFVWLCSTQVNWPPNAEKVLLSRSKKTRDLRLFSTDKKSVERNFWSNCGIVKQSKFGRAASWRNYSSIHMHVQSNTWRNKLRMGRGSIFSRPLLASLPVWTGSYEKFRTKAGYPVVSQARFLCIHSIGFKGLLWKALQTWTFLTQSHFSIL